MPFATNILGALTMALAITGGHAGQVFESHSKCTVKASGYSKEQLGVQQAKAVEDATAYVCGGEEKNEPKQIAEATATAFAKAVAKVFIDCRVKGKGSAKASGYAKAKAEGLAWLKAEAKAWAKAEVCGKCKAVAKAHVKVQEDIFLKAMAKAKASIDEYWSDDPDGDSGKLHAEDIEKDIVKKTATAVAEALANAWEDAKNQKCFAKVDVEAETPKNLAKCSAAGLSFSLNKVDDAVAEAVAKASKHSCDKDGFTKGDAYDVAEDVAKATAIAVAVANSKCTVKGTAKKVCASSDADIETVALAVAKATAKGWAKSNDCNCKVGGDAEVTSLGGYLADAAAKTWSRVCPKGKQSYFYDDDFNFDVDKDSGAVKAIAEALIDLVPGKKGGCAIDIDVETSVCECVHPPKTGAAECKSKGSDKVLTCCEKDYVCAKKKGGRGVCRPKDKVPSKKVLTPTCLEH